MDDEAEYIQLIFLSQRTFFKQSGKFSGGMKRRLSVAISAMGNPDVIFLDVSMPVFDGLYALEKIRELNPNATVFLIVEKMTLWPIG